MRALSISATNFKNQTFHQLLNAVTVIRGRNAIGKSSRIEALFYTLGGFVPGLNNGAGKPITQGSELIKHLGGGRDVRTEVETDVCIIWRELKDVRGSCKATLSEPGPFGLPAVALDPNTFLSLSGPEATRFMFARARLGDEFTISRLSNSITANIKNIVLEENTEASQAVISELVEYISTDAFECDADVTPQQWIATLTPALKEKLRLANENVRRMTQTVQGLTQIKESVSGGGDIAQRLATARQELDAANAEVARLRQVGVQRRQELDAAETTAKSAVNEDDIRRKLEEMKEPTPVSPAGEKPALGEMNMARPTDKKEREAFSAASAAATKSAAAMVEFQNEIQRFERAIYDAEKNSLCPTCGHDISDKQAKIIKTLKLQLGGTKENDHGPRKQLKNAQEAHETHRKFEENAGKALEAILIEIGAWDKAMLELRALNQTNLDLYNAKVTAYNNYQSELNKFNSEVAKLKSQLAGNATAAEAAAKVPQLQANLESAKLLYLESVEVSKNKGAALTALDTERLALEKQRAEAAAAAKSIAEAAKFKLEATVLKQTVNMMETLQEEIIKKSIQPLLDKANELCGDILRLPVTFHEGEFGMMDRGRMVTKTLSDSEKLLAYAGLSLALATEATYKLAVIGRYESFDVEKRHLIIQRALSLIRSGKLHQCLFVEVGAGSDYKCFECEPEFSCVTLI